MVWKVRTPPVKDALATLDDEVTLNNTSTFGKALPLASNTRTLNAVVYDLPMRTDWLSPAVFVTVAGSAPAR